MFLESKFTIDELFSSFDYHWDKYFTYAGERHNSWEIIYVLSGEVESVEEGRVYVLHEGDMLLHAPMEFHKIRSSGGTDPHLYILSFSTAGEIPRSLKEGIFNLSQAQHKHYIKCFALAQKCSSGNASEYEGQLCALHLSAFLIELSFNQGHSTLLDTPSAKEYHKAVRAMKQSVCENITLNELSNRCNISISYLKSLFKKYAGISPKNYYNNMRYDEALRLLKSGLSGAQTAERLNFSSESYFSFFMNHQKDQPTLKSMKNKNYIDTQF